MNSLMKLRWYLRSEQGFLQKSTPENYITKALLIIINDPYFEFIQASVLPWRSKRILPNDVAWRKNHEINIRNARLIRVTAHHGTDAWVRVVERYCIDSHKISHVVFARHVISIPSYHIKRTAGNGTTPQTALIFRDHHMLLILKSK